MTMNITIPAARGGAGLPPTVGNPVQSTRAFQRDPLGFTLAMTKAHGDIWQFRLGPTRTITLNHPCFIKRVLQENHPNYEKSSPACALTQKLFGLSVTTTNGRVWLRKRRLVQPAFHRRHIAALADTITDTVVERVERWRHEGAIDVTAEMNDLVVTVFFRALFGRDIDDHHSDVLARFLRAAQVVTAQLAAHLRFPFIPLSVPTPGHRRLHRNLRVMYDAALQLIQHYRHSGGDQEDIMSILVEAADDEGDQLSDAELRDEVVSLLFAGADTTKNLLLWTLYLVARHPEVADRLCVEIDTTVTGDRVTYENTLELTYLRAVIDESLRMYPPAWQEFRNTIDDDEIGGYRIPKGTQIFFTPFTVHRHPDFWPDPETFDPDRHLPGTTIDRSALIPFGIGPRTCIGNHFALIGAQLAIAEIMRRYRLALTDTVPVRPQPLVTLEADRPIVMRVTPR